MPAERPRATSDLLGRLFCGSCCSAASSGVHAARYRKGVLWSSSYFAASTGGAPLETVRKYVEQQRAE
ncbi:MAG: transposase [Chloracidobacterium sp.]|nr:transposase [Chloracidobacterium sp.]